MVTRPLVRIRWRLRGAWLWPVFVALTLLDGAIVHWLPPSGDRASPVAGWLIGLFLSLVGIIGISPLLARGLRRLSRDMPTVVARDYAGAGVVVTVTVVLLFAGLLHRQVVNSDQRALQDAIARAEAFIGDRAPAPFRDRQAAVDTWEIQPPEIYRICAHGRGVTETYCVVVNRSMPFGTSVKFSGFEPNSTFAEGI
jgi:hypothetical protein